MKFAGVPVYGVELSLTDNFVTAGNPDWIQIRAREENICFQKEALLNVAETIVPEQYTKIAWLDHDIYFENQNWYEDTSKALDTYNLVQLFDKCVWTDAYGEEERTAKSIFSLPKPITEETLIPPFWSPDIIHHSGFALAAKRDLWKKGVKLYPYNFIGGGDNVVAEAALFKDMTPRALRIAYQKVEAKPDSAFEYYYTWKQAFYEFVQEQYSFIPGKVYHEFHGSRQNRKYGFREKMLALYNINVKNNIILSVKGILTIKNPPAGFLEALKLYFIDRREDEIFNQTIKGIDHNPAP